MKKIALLLLLVLISFFNYSKVMAQEPTAACPRECDQAGSAGDSCTNGYMGGAEGCKSRGCTGGEMQCYPYDNKGEDWCENNWECDDGYECVGNKIGGTSKCEKKIDDPVQNAATFKCTCAGAFSACGTFAGRNNVKHRICTLATAGKNNCIKVGTGATAKYHQVLACSNSNLQCTCSANACSTTKCTFNKLAGITTYNKPIKCILASTLFTSVPTAINKADWCRRPNKTKGDANGDDKVTILDYFYYVSAKFGGKVPPTVNVDFNGDGQINLEDRAVIIKTL